MSGCFFLIKSKTLTVSSVSNNAEWAPADSNPFNLARDSSFIDLFPLAFSSVFKILSSIANAALTMFKASCLTLPSVFVKYGFLKVLKNSFLITSSSKLILE